MTTQREKRLAVEAAIAAAFRQVVLGHGICLRQAQAIDNHCHGISREEFLALRHGEVADDWSRLTLEELERDCVAFLDAEGFRYYIPALMLSVLTNYETTSMRVIGTLAALYPKKDEWEYHMRRYSLLTPAQKSAIAEFLAALPELVELSGEDRRTVPRAMRNYWHEFLSN